MASKKPDKTADKSVVRDKDGTILITLVFPKADVQKAKALVLADVQKDLTVPGFRKGMAPLSKVEENVKQNEIVERVLSKLFPKAFTDVLTKHAIRPAMYPKLQITKANPDEDWEVVATTAEMPVVELGDYKKEVAGAIKTKHIWTPQMAKKGADDANAGKEPTREEKYNTVVETLLSTSKVSIAKILVAEEAEAKLAKLLERLEKLGVSLESYLSSIKKDVATLRTDYETQAHKTISLDLILNHVAADMDIKVEDAEVTKVLQANSGVDNTEERQVVTALLKRQKALEALANTV
jgi:FKBP-type peptidyl-prolyl cis-trans isomerase (trigger factor)